jgi:protein-tyrosine-phosphatase
MTSPPDTDANLPAVLFLCIHNAGRSQMALGWFKQFADGRAVAYSGGSEPADHVNPAAIAAMNEIGIDIAHERPRRWREADLAAADVVITMGCGDTCPFVPGTRYEDWPIDDPAGLPVEAVRPIRDEIRQRVEKLLAEFGISTT